MHILNGLDTNELQLKCHMYRAKRDSLLSEWKEINGIIELSIGNEQRIYNINHTESVFVKDGIVCPEQWFTQKVRPLFLLKEAYGGSHDWDLVEDYLITGSTASKMWKRVAEWTYGIIESSAQGVAAYRTDLNHIKLGNVYLKQAAVVNVKKSGGEKSSDMDIIRAYAEFDRLRLYRQLELCDPTIIICGYTISALERIIARPIRQEWNENLYYRIELNGHDVIVLDYWHPGNQYPAIMNYYGLMGSYCTALQEKMKGD